MSFYGDTVNVQATGQDSLDRASKLLSGIPGGLDKAVRAAMARTVSHLRSSSTKAIREKYAISAQNLRTEENVKISYSYENGVQATVMFRGRKIPLHRYDGARPAQPTRDAGTLIRAYINDGFRMVHPSLPTYGRQFKETVPQRFDNAFVARMKSGHTGIFERTGGSTSNDKDEIREIMGSSIPQMLGNEEVEEKLSTEAVSKFNDRLDHEVWRVLNGYTGG